MKRVFFLIIIALLCNPAFTQAPESFNYQAVVRDETNNPITGQAVSFRISILKGNVSGPEEYIEIHNTSTNSLGLVTLAIGNGTDKVGDISSIDWGADSYYLQVEIDADGGTDYTLMGTTQLLSVPYAMYSKNAETYSETDPNAVLLTGDQTINGNKTFTGSTSVPEPVNETDAATKAYVDILLEKIERLENLTGMEPPISDVDGNIYQTIRIGTQVWMTENLKTTKYTNGDDIAYVTGNTEWNALTTGAYCWYNNDEGAYKDTYGAIYNWYTTVDVRNICPSGWHVSTDAEWVTLMNFLGSSIVAGGKLKEYGTMHWNSPNSYATNESNFTALPGGYRYPGGLFDYVGYKGFWWSSTAAGADAWFWFMQYNTSDLGKNYIDNNYGLSVRCIKD